MKTKMIVNIFFLINRHENATPFFFITSCFAIENRYENIYPTVPSASILNGGCRKKMRRLLYTLHYILKQRSTFYYENMSLITLFWKVLSVSNERFNFSEGRAYFFILIIFPFLVTHSISNRRWTRKEHIGYGISQASSQCVSCLPLS